MSVPLRLEHYVRYSIDPALPAVCIHTERGLDDLKVAPFRVYGRDMAGMFVNCRLSGRVCRMSLDPDPPSSGTKPTIWTFFAVTTDVLVTVHFEYVNSAPMSLALLTPSLLPKTNAFKFVAVAAVIMAAYCSTSIKWGHNRHTGGEIPSSGRAS